uniref:Resistance to inhibitors of cholinesterase protein 3 N-terminal domain-containing protein n=1 Tax=Meloidogyne javanica TaxID=6303 RepID=A0A915M0W7_MELJA
MSISDEYKNKIGGKTKKRRKMEKYYDEEYEDFIDCKRHKEELLPKWKLYAVCAAVFMCFALLYPSVFAPMINSFFGRNSDNKHSHQPNSHFSHPEGLRGYKLKSVQERLRKTEKAMNEILSQLELIATNKKTLNEGEDKSVEDENRIKEETQNMEESLEKLKV